MRVPPHARGPRTDDGRPLGRAKVVGARASSRKTGTRCGQEQREQAAPPLARPVPTKRLRNRMVVKPKTPRDGGDASAAVEHRGADTSDDLVNRDHEGV